MIAVPNTVDKPADPEVVAVPDVKVSNRSYQNDSAAEDIVVSSSVAEAVPTLTSSSSPIAWVMEISSGSIVEIGRPAVVDNPDAVEEASSSLTTKSTVKTLN